MEKFNFYFSFIFACIVSIFLGVVFSWGLWKAYLCLAISWFVLYAIGLGIDEEEKDKKAIAEAAKLYLERNK